MKLVSYHYGEQRRIGAAFGDWLVDLNRAYRETLKKEVPARAVELANCWVPGDMTRFLEGGDEAWRAAETAMGFVEAQCAAPDGLERLRRGGVLRPFREIRVAIPVPRPGKVICIGKNYADHTKELGGNQPSVPELFVRFASTLVAAGEPIVKPRESDQWDYEAELAVVIGKTARRVRRDRALEHVAGYSCLIDVTARDYQSRTSQWTAGKNFDHSGPFGPWLVTPDEVGDPQTLAIRLTIDGESMQDSNTKFMIFPVDFLIEHISEFVTLYPGDVISTGTPAGVGMGRKPPRFLKPGETVCCSVEKVGELICPVVGD